MAERILVCGGRAYNDAAQIDRILRAEAEREFGEIVIICGYNPDDAKFQGADELAFKWARSRGVPCFPFPAPWGKHGRSAGPLRNRRMFDCGLPTKGIAFPGGVGTANMVGILRANSVPVDEIGITA